MAFKRTHLQEFMDKDVHQRGFPNAWGANYAKPTALLHLPDQAEELFIARANEYCRRTVHEWDEGCFAHVHDIDFSICRIRGSVLGAYMG
jgi:hypothetical protein